MDWNGCFFCGVGRAVVVGIAVGETVGHEQVNHIRSVITLALRRIGLAVFEAVIFGETDFFAFVKSKDQILRRYIFGVDGDEEVVGVFGFGRW
jgi:hypothetical protein